MEFHVFDLVSASKLLYTINALDFPPFSSLSYRGHQKGFMSAPLQCVPFVGLPWVLLWGTLSTSEALQPLQVTLYRPLWIFLAEMWMWWSLPREVSSFCVAVSFYIWCLLSCLCAMFSLRWPAAICPLLLQSLWPLTVCSSLISPQLVSAACAEQHCPSLCAYRG